MSIWIFSSKDLENIKVAKERLMWGFWDKEAGEKMRKNWRDFIGLYNSIEPFDVVLFQIAKTGEIHAIGIVKDKHYDDQTLIWPIELEEKRVLFPWRVEFIVILFSEEPITTLNIKKHKYIDGYGIGEVKAHEVQSVLRALEEKLGDIKINLNYGRKFE